MMTDLLPTYTWHFTYKKAVAWLYIKGCVSSTIIRFTPNFLKHSTIENKVYFEDPIPPFVTWKVQFDGVLIQVWVFVNVYQARLPIFTTYIPHGNRLTISYLHSEYIDTHISIVSDMHYVLSSQSERFQRWMLQFHNCLCWAFVLLDLMLLNCYLSYWSMLHLCLYGKGVDGSATWLNSASFTC